MNIEEDLKTLLRLVQLYPSKYKQKQYPKTEEENVPPMKTFHNRPK
jgi:hypothetical protein